MKNSKQKKNIEESINFSHNTFHVSRLPVAAIIAIAVAAAIIVIILHSAFVADAGGGGSSTFRSPFFCVLFFLSVV